MPHSITLKKNTLEFDFPSIIWSISEIIKMILCVVSSLCSSGGNAVIRLDKVIFLVGNLQTEKTTNSDYYCNLYVKIFVKRFALQEKTINFLQDNAPSNLAQNPSLKSMN